MGWCNFVLILDKIVGECRMAVSWAQKAPNVASSSSLFEHHTKRYDMSPKMCVLFSFESIHLFSQKKIKNTTHNNNNNNCPLGHLPRVMEGHQYSGRALANPVPASPPFIRSSHQTHRIRQANRIEFDLKSQFEKCFCCEEGVMRWLGKP